MSVLSGGSEAVYKLFSELGTLHTYDKNSFVYLRGEPTKSAFYIESGFLKVCHFSDLGQEFTLFLRKKGDIFGIAEVILNQNRQSNAICMSDCRIWSLNASLIQEKLRTMADVSAEILYTITSRLIQEQRLVEMLVSKPVAWRLAWLLQELSEPQADGTYRIDTPFTQEELSKIIGCSRQTVSELLSDWRGRGIIRYNRKQMIVCDFSELLD